MPIERYIVRRVSCDRGVKISQLAGRFGFSMKDDQTLVFDDVKEAEEFARALQSAIQEYKGVE